MKKMKALSLSALAVSLAFLSGCYVPQFMPATNIECRVIDVETKKPISGAKLYMVYHGENNSSQKRGPFFTDSDGLGFIDVKMEAIWQSGVYAGFSGGQKRVFLSKLQAILMAVMEKG